MNENREFIVVIIGFVTVIAVYIFGAVYIFSTFKLKNSVIFTIYISFLATNFYNHISNVTKSRVDSDSYSYETEAIIEEKNIQHRVVLVGKIPSSTNSYEVTVSIPDENGNDLKTTVTVSYALYDALNVGDSVIVTVYTDKKTNELVKVSINTQ